MEGWHCTLVASVGHEVGSTRDPTQSIRSAITSTLPEADFSDVVVLGKGIATTAYRFNDPSVPIRQGAVRLCDYPESRTQRRTSARQVRSTQSAHPGVWGTN